jgi:hypothetical protein
MNTNALAGKAITNAVPVALGIGVLLFAVYFLLRKAVGDTVGVVADTAGGILSGNNALTKDSAYEDKGVLGTLGAGANAVSGGSLAALGESISSWLSGSGDAALGSMIYYSVIFPDGARHAIGDADIDKQGFFTYAKVRYRLGVSATGSRVAVRV